VSRATTALLGAMATVGCAASPPPATSPAPARVTRDVLISDSFSPRRGAEALKAFTPVMPAVDSGGECSLSRSAGSGATTVIATFPSHLQRAMSVAMTFDSAGHLVRYSESRGLPSSISTAGMTPRQRDSTLADHLRATRSTNITLDWAVDHGIVSNRVPGNPTEAVLATVREVEALPQLGPVSARLERVRKLCGV
jgi:hypothetical protein